ncbi:MAG TPA: adenylate/guanylate cyclase domain-containing protein [Nitrobacter sp.]|nr:adenylate/guanylate cyclase domain-containing protein [Nitrobacter sp.]
MTPSPPRQLRKLIHGFGLRQLRLCCGLVLFAYLLSHFLNHALGIVSMEALETGVYYHTVFWQFLPVAVIFYAAIAIHISLGFWALYERRQFRWKAIEPLQLLLGLSIPALVVAHVVGLRLGQALYEQEKLYPQVFFADWVTSPDRKWLMVLALTVAWLHGCIGVYFWLRMKAFFARAAPFLLAAAILVPTLAMLGLYQGGRTVVAASQDAAWRTENLGDRQIGTPHQQDVLADITDYSLIGYLGLIGLALIARGIRLMAERRGRMITLSFGNDRTVRVPRGLSVLEASLLHNIPHASICGGRARCSTCRIRILGDPSVLPSPSKREAFVLDRVGAGADPAVRLACQLRPETDLSFLQLFLPHTMSANAHAAQPSRIGQECYLVSMFVDMRGSTKLAEQRLPFDTVFIVNRFLNAVSAAVIASGGQPNQFVGDGLLALFGLHADPKRACRQAIQAAAAISTHIDELNRFLHGDLKEPVRFGIGMHAGEVIIGDIGYRDHMVFTALGDAVNVAARLQDMTKTLACEVVISNEVFSTAQMTPGLQTETVSIRGRSEQMIVQTATDAKILSSIADATDPVAA